MLLQQSPDFPHLHLLIDATVEFRVSASAFPLSVLYFHEAIVVKVMTPYVPKG